MKLYPHEKQITTITNDMGTLRQWKYSIMNYNTKDAVEETNNEINKLTKDVLQPRDITENLQR